MARAGRRGDFVALVVSKWGGVSLAYVACHGASFPRSADLMRQLRHAACFAFGP